MRSLACYLKEYKKESILAPFFKFLEVVFDLIVPLVIAQIIDVGVAQNDHGYIVQRFFILILMAAARSYLQLHRPVLRSESQRRLRRKSPSGRFRPHPAPLIYRAGYPRNRHPDYPSD